jgi:hypothetical protein
MLQFSSLPVGFETLHSNSFLNYQLNRAHGLGWLQAQDIGRAADQVRTLADVPGAFARASETAEAQGQLRVATGLLLLLLMPGMVLFRRKIGRFLTMLVALLRTPIVCGWRPATTSAARQG